MDTLGPGVVGGVLVPIFGAAPQAIIILGFYRSIRRSTTNINGHVAIALRTIGYEIEVILLFMRKMVDGGTRDHELVLRMSSTVTEILFGVCEINH